MSRWKKFFQTLILGMVILVMVGCSSSQDRYFTRSTEIAAVVFATQTAEEKLKPTSTRTPSITPSPTLTPTPVPPSEWPLVFSESFDSNENDWPMGKETNNFVENNWTLTGGKYRWIVTAIQDVHWYVYPDIKSVSDFYLSAELQRISGPEDCSYGIAFRVKDDNNFYLFLISDTQYFSVYRINNGIWKTLLDWRYSSAIGPERINRIEMVAQGSHFDFWVNEKLVGAVDDNLIKTGRNGVTMILYNPGDHAVFEFDNFEVREP
jgi:hypothetical protein